MVSLTYRVILIFYFLFQITGITGILMYTGRLHKIKLNFEEDYLYFSIFHLIASIIIISGLIWVR